jgi:hypothetical protein
MRPVSALAGRAASVCLFDGGLVSPDRLRGGATRLALGAGFAGCVTESGAGFRHFLTVVWSGLPTPREPAYADKRSKDCGAMSASE